MLKNSILAIAFFSLFFTSANARIRHVPGEYPTIQDQYLVLSSLFLTTGIQDYIDSTVIDGSASGHVVTFQTGEDSRAVIAGFTITNGHSDNGGGIYCENSSPVISNNIITGNTTYTGFWPYGQGAGIYCENSEATILNNLIINNNASGTDGGRGGGIFCENSSPDIINNTFYGNQAMWYGGAVFSNSSMPVITNCILWGNNAPEGSEIYYDGSAPVVTYTDIYAGWPGEGNINSNPEFRNRNQGDFHLMSTEYGYPYDSPCIDAGAPFIRDMALDSLWGLGTFSSDMGAYGGGDFEQAAIEDGIPDSPKEIALVKNYPNPFNSQTVISFYLTEPGDVSIEIFDILGRGIETIHKSYLESGRHSFIWDGENCSGGIYFYFIKGETFQVSRKMLLLK